jgi:hypothetical protein
MIDSALPQARRTTGDAGAELGLVEGLGHIVVGAGGQGLDLGVHLRRARQDDHRRRQLLGADGAQRLQAGHVLEVEVHEHRIVGIELDQFDALLAGRRGGHVVAARGQDQFDALGRGRIVFHQQDMHVL